MACTVCGVETKAEHDALQTRHAWTEIEGDLREAPAQSGKTKTVEQLAMEVDALQTTLGELVKLMVDKKLISISDAIGAIRQSGPKT